MDANGQIMRITGTGDGSPNGNPGKLIHIIDFIEMGASVSQKITIPCPAAKTGLSVSVSPGSELPDGLVIAYARVAQPGVIEVKFTNVTPNALQLSDLELLISLY